MILVNIDDWTIIPSDLEPSLAGSFTPTVLFQKALYNYEKQYNLFYSYSPPLLCISLEHPRLSLRYKAFIKIVKSSNPCKSQVACSSQTIPHQNWSFFIHQVEDKFSFYHQLFLQQEGWLARFEFS